MSSRGPLGELDTGAGVDASFSSCSVWCMVGVSSRGPPGKLDTGAGVDASFSSCFCLVYGGGGKIHSVALNRFALVWDFRTERMFALE